jgi:hypothetical protein
MTVCAAVGASGTTPVVGIALPYRRASAELEPQETTATTRDTDMTDTVKPGSVGMTDEDRASSHVKHLGYQHKRVNHADKHCVIGEGHTNTLEGAWSHFKLSIRASYIGVSPKHLQK